jgi:photosynthetic reaction center H subunit
MRQEDRTRLVPLSEAPDFQVSQGDPDVRGWLVHGAEGSPVGVVDDIIVDLDAERVRYLCVRLDDAGESDELVLIPVGLATLEPERDAVSVPTVTVASMEALERHGGGLVEREYEIAVRRGIIAAAPEAAGDLRADASDEDEFYAHAVYDENRFYEPRRRTLEREVLENMAVTSVSDTDDSPVIVGEVSAGQVDVPIVEDSDHLAP